MRRPRKFPVFSLIVFVPILAACHGPTVHVKAVPDQIPAGWAAGKSADGLVRIGIPAGWRFGVDKMASPLDMAGGGDPSQSQFGQGQQTQFDRQMQQMASDMQKQSDEQEKKELADLAAKGVVINVISTGSRPTPGEARTRYYVKRTEGHSSLVDAADVERKQFVHKPDLTNITLPIGPAVKMEETRTQVDGGVFHQRSYVVVDGNDMYSVRFITEEQASIVDSISDQVMQTLRITPSR